MNIELLTEYITGSLQHNPGIPDLGEVISANLFAIIFSLLILIGTIVGKYAIATKALGKKEAIKAIIPVYGLMLCFRAIGLNPWLAITCYIPIVGFIPYCVFCFLVPKAFGQKIGFQLLSLLFPYVMFNVLGFDKKYEFQYVKGKNVAFKNEFRTVMPGDMTTPSDAVNGAAVNSLGATESLVSRAASAAAEQTRIIREEQEKLAAEEARKKAEEEASKKPKQKPEEFNYDIFNSEKSNLGPESASLNISFNVINGRFVSTPMEGVPAPEPQPMPAPAPAPEPVPVEPAAEPQPVPVQPVPAPMPVQAPAPAPVPEPVAPAPVQPVPQPAPAQPTQPVQPAPGIQISTIPPNAA